MPRPDFLQKPHTSGRTIVANFKTLSVDDAVAVDKWLLTASMYGSMTWQETTLFEWINDREMFPHITSVTEAGATTKTDANYREEY